MFLKHYFYKDFNLKLLQDNAMAIIALVNVTVILITNPFFNIYSKFSFQKY